MKKNLHIAAILDQPDFLEDMVEKLASKHYNKGNNKQKIMKGNDVIETSSNETYISGTLAINDTNQRINMPFITSFLFTCIKEKDDDYKLEWGLSLS